MLCKAGKCTCPHCMETGVLPWQWRKRSSSAHVPPAGGNCLCNKGKICRVPGQRTIGSGKSMARGSVLWQIAHNRQDYLQESFFCVCRKLYILHSILLKKIHLQTLNMNSLVVRQVCDFQTSEVFSPFLTADLPSADKWPCGPEENNRIGSYLMICLLQKILKDWMHLNTSAF